MAPVVAILDFLWVHLVILCNAHQHVLLQLGYSGDVQNINSQQLSYINVLGLYKCMGIVLGFNDTSTLVGHFVSLPEKGRREIEEIVEEMKESDRGGGK